MNNYLYILLGLILGLIMGYLMCRKPKCRGPNSNDVRKKIRIDKNGECYKLVPQIHLSPKKLM